MLLMLHQREKWLYKLINYIYAGEKLGAETLFWQQMFVLASGVAEPCLKCHRRLPACVEGLYKKWNKLLEPI